MEILVFSSFALWINSCCPPDREVTNVDIRCRHFGSAHQALHGPTLLYLSSFIFNYKPYHPVAISMVPSTRWCPSRAPVASSSLLLFRAQLSATDGKFLPHSHGGTRKSPGLSAFWVGGMQALPPPQRVGPPGPVSIAVPGHVDGSVVLCSRS